MDKYKNPFIICPNCINNRAQLKGVLLDIFPQERFKTNVILFAFDEGIAAEIDKVSSLDNILANRYTKILMSVYGTSQENAQRAVDFWFDCYGVAVLGKDKSVEWNHKKESFLSQQVESTNQQLQPNSADDDVISVMNLKENEKVPKALIHRFISDANRQGILNLNISVRKQHDYGSYTFFKATGEYMAKTPQYTLLLIIVYNANNEMIEANYSERIAAGFNGKATFSKLLEIPSDEYISRIDVRFTPDPAFS